MIQDSRLLLAIAAFFAAWAASGKVAEAAAPLTPPVPKPPPAGLPAFKLDFVRKLYLPAERTASEMFGKDGLGKKRDAIITQAAHESDWGRSGLSSPGARLQILPGKAVGPALNIFGFKSGADWLRAQSPYVLMWTKEQDPKTGKWERVLAPFRVYASWEESLRDWARLMTTRFRYRASADALRTGDPLAFFRAVGASGYATDKIYGEKLAGVYGSVERAVV